LYISGQTVHKSTNWTQMDKMCTVWQGVQKCTSCAQMEELSSCVNEQIEHKWTSCSQFNKMYTNVKLEHTWTSQGHALMDKLCAGQFVHKWTKGAQMDESSTCINGQVRHKWTSCAQFIKSQTNVQVVTIWPSHAQKNKGTDGQVVHNLTRRAELCVNEIIERMHEWTNWAQLGKSFTIWQDVHNCENWTKMEEPRTCMNGQVVQNLTRGAQIGGVEHTHEWTGYAQIGKLRLTYQVTHKCTNCPPFEKSCTNEQGYKWTSSAQFIK
jgi:hypothetical protein